jgi:hypothetical protein
LALSLISCHDEEEKSPLMIGAWRSFWPEQPEALGDDAEEIWRYWKDLMDFRRSFRRLGDFLLGGSCSLDAEEDWALLVCPIPLDDADPHPFCRLFFICRDQLRRRPSCATFFISPLPIHSQFDSWTLDDPHHAFHSHFCHHPPIYLLISLRLLRPTCSGFVFTPHPLAVPLARCHPCCL